MRKNGKLAAAFIAVGLLAAAIGAGALYVIWYAGDFEAYVYKYQTSMISIAAFSAFTFILACCFAAGFSGAYRRAYFRLAAMVREAEAGAAENSEMAAETPAPVIAEVPAEVPAPKIEAPVPVASTPEVDSKPITPAPSIPKLDAETLGAIKRAREYASEIKRLAAREDAAGVNKDAPDKSDVKTLIEEIDDVAFRVHLLSLNIAIESSNSENADEFAAITDEVQNLENLSASVAGRCNAVFGAVSACERNLEGDKKRDKIIGELADRIEMLAGKVAAVNAGIAKSKTITQPNSAAESKTPAVASPIDPSVGGGLYA
jgi:hypothetical protein